MLLNLVTKIYSIWIVTCSWIDHTILLLMFVAEKVLLLLVISLTDHIGGKRPRITRFYWIYFVLIFSHIFSCDQAALWMVFSVRLSVCLSVCPSVCLSVCPSVRLSVCPSVTPFWLCSHHRIIMKFSGVITLDQGKVYAKGQGQRSKVKVTEVTTQIFVSGR